MQFGNDEQSSNEMNGKTATHRFFSISNYQNPRYGDMCVWVFCFVGGFFYI